VGTRGFEAKPVRAVTKKSREPVSNLWELAITGWGGVAPAESGVVEVEGPCPTCGQRTYTPFTDPSKLIDRTRWDGSDIFVVWPFPVSPFLTEALAKDLRSRKFAGIRFLPLADVPCPSPGPVRAARLSHWFSEERAREIARQSGLLA